MPALPLLDQSDYAHEVRPFNGATGSPNGRYSTPGLLFNGVNQYHLIANRSAFNLGQQFTIEADVNTLTAIPSGREACILSLWQNGRLSYFFGINSARQMTFYTSVDGTNGIFSKVTASNTFPASGYAHVAVARDASDVLRLFIEGAVLFSTTDTSTYFASTADLGIGGHAGLDPGAFIHNCEVDNLRQTVGVCRYTSAFTPPGDLPVGGADPDWANVTLLLKGGLRNLDYKAVGQHSYVRLGGPSASGILVPGHKVKDIYHNGRGRVSGTTKINGTPDTPVRRRVLLLEDRSRAVIRQQWSDPVTGEYTFDHLDETKKYTALAYDHTFLYRAVAADNQTPTLMP